MPRSDLHRTTSFRLASLFFVFFAAASLALFGLLYLRTSGYLASLTDDWLRREQGAFTSLNDEGAMERLAARRIADPNLERPFVLFDPMGKRLAGSDLDLSPALLAATPDDHPFEFDVRQGDETLRFRGMLRRAPSGNRVLIAEDMAGTQQFDKLLIRSFLWGGLVTAVLGLAGAVLAGLKAVARIDEVTHATERIVAGDLSERLPARGKSGDLDRLAHVINGMLAETERLMHEVKGVGDNIAHDLRTPLTRLLAGLERARRRAGSTDEYGAAVDEAIAEIRGVLRTFTALLRISEVESGARRAGFTAVDLGLIAADVVEFYDPIAEERGIVLQTARSGAPGPVMRGDPNLLFDAIGNLVDNALKYTPRGGRVSVRSFAVDGRPGIEVTDSGPGIPPAQRATVLRRFHRLEESRHTPGTGLGLTLVGAVARLHGMELSVGDAMPGCRITFSCGSGPDGAASSETSPACGSVPHPLDEVSEDRSGRWRSSRPSA